MTSKEQIQHILRTRTVEFCVTSLSGKKEFYKSEPRPELTQNWVDVYPMYNKPKTTDGREFLLATSNGLTECHQILNTFHEIFIPWEKINIVASYTTPTNE
ncbi:MAG: hypothetical protein AB7G44_04365 [Bacteroidia bacterium]